MPRRRATITELQRSGTWRFMSKAAQAARIAEETGVPDGWPAPPGELSAKGRASFLHICSQLQTPGILRADDGPLIAEYIAADQVRRGEIDQIMRARLPQEVPPPNAFEVARGYSRDGIHAEITREPHNALAVKPNRATQGASEEPTP